jgi:hypothetical protein
LDKNTGGQGRHGRKATSDQAFLHWDLVEFSLGGDRLLGAKRLDFSASGDEEMANSEGPSAVVGPPLPCEQSNKTQ